MKKNMVKTYNRLVSLEISIQSLNSIINCSNLKATLWSDDGGIESSELIIDMAKVKKEALKRRFNLLKEKKEILTKLNKNDQVEIQNKVKNDFLVKNTYKLY